MNRLPSSTTRRHLNLASLSPAALLLGVGLAFGGCADAASDPPPVARAPEASAASLPEVGVVRELAAGDRGCYVTFEDAEGRRSDAVASYELCERTELVGQRVQLRRERTPILAMSCEGDQECVRRDTVDLIVAAEKLP